MRKINLIAAMAFSVILLSNCKKEGEKPAANINICSTKTIDFTTSKEDEGNCEKDGQITISAFGSTGFTFQLQSGAFQTSNSFKGLVAGIYSITVKDIDGCTKTKEVTINQGGTIGNNFLAVKDLLNMKCAISACHTANGAVPNIFSTDCKIVSKGTLMKVKAVDNNMGNLDSTEKAVISAWLASGGKYTN